jgi:hypothetical protein
MRGSTIEEWERVIEQGSGREPAICELRCDNCGDGLRFDQRQCSTCGETSPRFRTGAHVKRVEKQRPFSTGDEVQDRIRNHSLNPGE